MKCLVVNLINARLYLFMTLHEQVRQWHVPIDGANEDGNKAICKFVKLHR